MKLLVCYAFIAWLLWRDRQFRRFETGYLLIPFVWVAIQSSRPVSYWFGFGGSESNPINTIFFGGFLLASLFALNRAGIKWSGFLLQNKPLFFLYGYLLCSVLWSEMPGASLKRIIKDFESVLVAAVILVHRNPAEAIRAIYVRAACILFPLSVLFIKYYPHIGRQANRAGENMFTGVTTQKNTLGLTVFVFGLVLLWDYIESRKSKQTTHQKVLIGLFAMGIWLVITCDSQTSLLCLLLGCVLIFGLKFLRRVAAGKRILVSALVSLVLLISLDKSVGISDSVIRAMGRDPTLTGRTGIWDLVLQQQSEPLTGFGFCIFWDSDKGLAVIEELMLINSAHNGYLEIYLDGGAIGLVLLAIFLLTAGKRAIDVSFKPDQLSCIAFAVWFLSLLYNMSESSFFRLDILWFTLILVTLKVPTFGKAITNNDSV